jgi:hypothetical protein
MSRRDILLDELKKKRQAELNAIMGRNDWMYDHAKEMMKDGEALKEANFAVTEHILREMIKVPNYADDEVRRRRRKAQKKARRAGR